MVVKLIEFPHQPKTLSVCNKCTAKVCVPNPTKCMHFINANHDFIESKKREARYATSWNRFYEDFLED